MADYQYHNAMSLRPLLAKEGVQMHKVPEDLMMAMAKETKGVLEEVADSSPLAGEIYDSFLKYRDIASEYIMNAEWEIVRMRAMAIEKRPDLAFSPRPDTIGPVIFKNPVFYGRVFAFLTGYFAQAMT